MRTADERLSDILSRLQGVAEVGSAPGQYEACCPAHDDTKASLHLRCGDKNPDLILINCKAGCTTCDVLRAIGLDQRILFPARRGEQSGKNGGGRQKKQIALPADRMIVATYDYCDSAGTLLFQVVRFEPKDFRQRRPKEGRPGWIWSVKDAAKVPYRLQRIAAADVDTPVFVVEGEKDVHAIEGLGLVATCNPGGAGKWLDHYSRHLAGRDVVILPDNDDPGRNHAISVARSAQPLARSVKIVELPGLPIKGDVSDWIAQGGTREELLQLADACEPLELEDDTGEAEDDPHRLARLCIKKMPPVRYWRGEFYIWMSPCYRPANDDEILALIDRTVKAEFDRLYRSERSAKGDEAPGCRKVSVNLKANVLDALKALTLIDFARPMPHWLDDSIGPPPESCVVTKNGIIPVDDLGAYRAPTPDLFTTNAVNFGFDWEADCPEWKAFLGTLWSDDKECQNTLQEMFGYMLLPETRYQKMFLLVGPRRSGKGTIARVLREVVGPQNVAAPTLGSLAGEFGLQPLLGRTVAIIGDARLSGRSDSAAIVERILSITGQDLQTVNRKHMSAVSDVLPTRFVLISNELPRLDDASATFPSRVILLRLLHSFYGREDHALTDRLLLEAPGILNWAMQGLYRLRARGHFVQPESSRELLEDLETLSSPMAAFVKDRCELGAGFTVDVRDLYESYRTWCDEKGRKPSNEQIFGRDLRAVAPSVGCKQRRHGGVRVRAYEHIRLMDWSHAVSRDGHATETATE